MSKIIGECLKYEGTTCSNNTAIISITFYRVTTCSFCSDLTHCLPQTPTHFIIAHYLAAYHFILNGFVNIAQQLTISQASSCSCENRRRRAERDSRSLKKLKNKLAPALQICHFTSRNEFIYLPLLNSPFSFFSSLDFQKQKALVCRQYYHSAPIYLSCSHNTMTTSRCRPVVICGPSGVGKGTLIELLQKQFPDNKFGVSLSTRYVCRHFF